MYVFIDAETTGFKKSGELIQDNQARVCQIAAIVADKDAKILSQFSTLVKPEGWTISEGAKKVHGISDIDCIMYGMKQSDMVDIVGKLCRGSEMIVAHNAAFDRAMMEVELAYFGAGDPYLDDWYCIMTRNTHINNGKWPKLEQTLQHYTGRTLGDTAHDAMVDARACMDIFFAMQNN